MLFSKDYKNLEFIDENLPMSGAMQRYIFELMELEKHQADGLVNMDSQTQVDLYTEQGNMLLTRLQARKQELYIEQINQVNFAGKMIKGR